jgi:hypothetical protein
LRGWTVESAGFLHDPPAMTDEERPPHPKDRAPIEEGVIIPADELHRVNDDAPTENVDPVTHDGEVLDKRPTDGPL